VSWRDPSGFMKRRGGTLRGDGKNEELFHAREPTSAIAGPVTSAALDSRALTNPAPCALAVWPERTLRITSANYDEAFSGLMARHHRGGAGRQSPEERLVVIRARNPKSPARARRPAQGAGWSRPGCPSAALVTGPAIAEVGSRRGTILRSFRPHGVCLPRLFMNQKESRHDTSILRVPPRCLSGLPGRRSSGNEASDCRIEEGRRRAHRIAAHGQLRLRRCREQCAPTSAEVGGRRIRFTRGRLSVRRGAHERAAEH